MIDKMASSKADRGWAWMIVAGVTIINLSVLPIQQCFGLIFAPRFASLGITATQISLILHLNGTIACSMGLISGPMMRRFSFRNVAFFGGLTIAVGVCACAFAASLSTIIITYCVITGIGHGIVYPATCLALNTYFRKRRNMAMGFSVTLTGLGPILMPLLIVKLLEYYATTGTLLIFSGIATHSFIGASLLRPFKTGDERASQELKDCKKTSHGSKEEEATRKTSDAGLEKAENGEAECRLLSEVQDEQCKAPYISEDSQKKERKSAGKVFLEKIGSSLDLGLLKDLRYVAIVLGMGVSLVAETNFNLMIPFVLAELSGLEMKSIATVMSIQAASDITGRLCVPLVAQRAKWTSRNLYVVSLLGFTVGRTILSTWGTSYVVVIGVAVIVGMAKGTKAVFQALIIPDYVPLERLPAASGIQMVFSGILSITVGPIIGLVHDLTQSYVGALHFTSFLSISCVFLWVLGGVWTPITCTAKRNQAENSKNEVKS